jgi:hypothetical protein
LRVEEKKKEEEKKRRKEQEWFTPHRLELPD